MVLRDPLNPNSLYRLDLQTGKVVEEYKVGALDVDNFLPGSKFAQTTGEQTFIGHSKDAVFRIDPRLSGSKLVESEYKQYKTKNDFSAAATTEAGHLAVASNKGDIRLYDALGKNAKTALPALGDAIIGIDVTKDGRYVIATTKTYLLLIDTLIGEGRYEGSLGCTLFIPIVLVLGANLDCDSRTEFPSYIETQAEALDSSSRARCIHERQCRFYTCEI